MPITSTSGTRNGGFHQWVPSARSRRCKPCMISVIGITEVLLARIVSGRTCFSISAKIFCFSAMSSSTASTTIIGIAHASARSATGRTRSTAVSSSPRSRRLAAMRGLAASSLALVRVGDRDVVAGEREHLRDAVAHQAGADDGDARLRRHQSARCVAAVGVEDVAGVEIRRLGGEEQQRPGEIGRLAQPALRHAG